MGAATCSRRISAIDASRSSRSATSSTRATRGARLGAAADPLRPRRARGTVPVTISVGGADPVASLRALKAALAGAEPDFYTIHYYGGSGEQAYWTLQAGAGGCRPVPLWVGETGYPTSTRTTGYSDLPLTRQAQEAAQAHFLKTVAYAALQLGLPPPGVWTLDDFEPGSIPADAGLQNERRVPLRALPDRRKPEGRCCRGAQQLRVDAASSDSTRGSRTVSAPAHGGSISGRMVGVRQRECRRSPSQATDRGAVRATPSCARSAGLRADGTFFVAPIMSTPPPGAVRAEASVWVRSRSADAAGALAAPVARRDRDGARDPGARTARAGRGWKQVTRQRPPACRARARSASSCSSTTVRAASGSTTSASPGARGFGAPGRHSRPRRAC